MEENEVPLKIIELADFVRFPWILSKKLQYRQAKEEQVQESQPGIVLFKQKPNLDGQQRDYARQNELVVPKDTIIFADEIDRKKIGVLKKSNNLFSRHLLITSGAALQALIPSLTNAKEWIILSKLKFIKRYTKTPPIHGDVLISLNINHPLVRYEILTALDLLQQSFNEVKSAYIVIDFSRILHRWFRNYLKRTDQYPSLRDRFLYRYSMETSKCSITLGKRHSHDIFNQTHTFPKFIHKSDYPIQIYIDFNTLPTIVYSIQSDNIFIYSMNDQYKQIVKEIGNGLSLVSIQNVHSIDEQVDKPSHCLAILPKQEEKQQQLSLRGGEEDDEQQQPQQIVEPKISNTEKYQASEEEKQLFEKIFNNRIRIEMQHQHLMFKAAQILCFSSMEKSLFDPKSTHTNYF